MEVSPNLNIYRYITKNCNNSHRLVHLCMGIVLSPLSFMHRMYLNLAKPP